jgi:hypothetical protein
MSRLLSFLAAIACMLASPVEAASLAGYGSGRAQISGDLGSFQGLVQQTISNPDAATTRVVSNLIVVSTPESLAIADRILITSGRVRFRTNFTIAECNCRFVTLTGRAQVGEETILYSARSRKGTVRIRGVIRLEGNLVVRTETRRESGASYTIRTVIRRQT